MTWLTKNSKYSAHGIWLENYTKSESLFIVLSQLIYFNVMIWKNFPYKLQFIQLPKQGPALIKEKC